MKLFGKSVPIVVYAYFFLSDKNIILLKCVHTFLMHIFIIYAHIGVFIQHLFYAIIQNVHTNRWMETQLVIVCLYFIVWVILFSIDSSIQ